MKKGCFIRSIVIITILIAAALYIIENKFDEFFLEPGKKYLADLVEVGLKEDMEKIADSPEKDTLSIMLKSYLKEFKESKKFKISSDDLDSFSELLNDTSKDSVITKNELEEISNLLEKIKNEGLQKN
jgi:hypothetical protein